MRNMGVGSWPYRQARRVPENVALRYDGRALTYAEVNQLITRLAHALTRAGVRAGDRVAYLGHNHPAFIETMFATQLIGAVFVPINFRLAAPEIDYVLAQSGARLLVYGPECDAMVRDLTAFSGKRVCVESEPASEDTLEQLIGAVAQDPTDSARYLDAPVTLDDPALILYTSGTTGRPKGAVLTHGNIVFNALNMMIDVDVRHDEVALIAAPLFHVAALNQLFMPSFLKGATSLLMARWDVDGCFDAIERDGVTWIFGVTAMFAGLVQSPRWADADLSSLRQVMSGGAPIPTSLIYEYQRRGVVFCQGYGLTETAPGATFLGPEKSITKAGSAGAPCFFADVKLVRPDFTEARPGEPGEVLISGPNVTPGYWNDEAATASALTPDGWLRSGDVATRDVDGYLTIIDRLKDMYISGGENVYPAEVETVATEYPGVLECAVIGVPDDRWGEVGAAFIVANPEFDVTAFRLFLSKRLAKYKVPVQINVVDSLARTGSGKVRKALLRELANGQALVDEAETGPSRGGLAPVHRSRGE